eukprot:m.480615 g.480615  ORF g.480615 m.480615 type:complete len:725 (+) comp21708_c0_seq2:110-2284(+)
MHSNSLCAYIPPSANTSKTSMHSAGVKQGRTLEPRAPSHRHTAGVLLCHTGAVVSDDLGSNADLGELDQQLVQAAARDGHVYLAPLDLEGFLACDPHRVDAAALPAWVAESPKNRYPDILPTWATRVRLPVADVPATTPEADAAAAYINANHVTDALGHSAYIATQAPLAHTVADFWFMVWSENAECVVMLTRRQEHGVRYWPAPDGSTMTCGVLTVRCVDVTQHRHYDVHHLLLGIAGADAAFARPVRHYLFKAWPDTGIPVTGDGRADPTGLLALLSDVRHHRTGAQPPPVVVHCSAGIGRTGVYLLVDTAITLLEHGRPVDLVAVLAGLRTCRPWLVQRVSQYKLAWQAVVAAARLKVGVLSAHHASTGTARACSIYSLESSMNKRLSREMRRHSLSQGAQYDMTRIGAEMAFQLRTDAPPVRITDADDRALAEHAAPAALAASGADGAAGTRTAGGARRKRGKVRETVTKDDVGKRVVVSGYDCLGTLRFVGIHFVHQTPRVGIELDAPIGKNSGTVSGHKYFECAPKCGLLATPAKVTFVHGSAVPTKRAGLSVDDVGCLVFVKTRGLGTLAWVPPPASDAPRLFGVVFNEAVGDSDGTLAGTRHFSCDANHGMFLPVSKIRRLSPNANDVGRLVTVRGYDSIGVLRFHGAHHHKGGVRCGVELDQPIGNNDGTVQGHEYFVCAKRHGVLCVPQKVFLHYAGQNLTFKTDAGAGGTSSA